MHKACLSAAVKARAFTENLNGIASFFSFHELLVYTSIVLSFSLFRQLSCIPIRLQLRDLYFESHIAIGAASKQLKILAYWRCIWSFIFLRPSAALRFWIHQKDPVHLYQNKKKHVKRKFLHSLFWWKNSRCTTCRRHRRNIFWILTSQTRNDSINTSILKSLGNSIIHDSHCQHIKKLVWYCPPESEAANYSTKELVVDTLNFLEYLFTIFERKNSKTIYLESDTQGGPNLQTTWNGHPPLNIAGHEFQRTRVAYIRLKLQSETTIYSRVCSMLTNFFSAR